MTDVLTKEQRHKNMKNIRGKDTRIEAVSYTHLDVYKRQTVKG